MITDKQMLYGIIVLYIIGLTFIIYYVKIYIDDKKSNQESYVVLGQTGIPKHPAGGMATGEDVGPNQLSNILMGGSG